MEEEQDNTIINLCDCRACDYCKIIDANNLRLVGGETMTEGYCTRCKAKKEVQNGVRKEYDTSKGKKYQVSGTCPTCNGRISVFVKGGIQ